MMNNIKNQTKSSNIAIIGKPNAGKSTLLNRLIGHKIAIVTPKVQTTRSSITGIITHENTQLVFIDTPGIFAANTRFEKAMVKCAWSNALGADMIIFLIDSCKEFDTQSKQIAKKVSDSGSKMIFVINKIDSKKSNSESILKEILELQKDAQIFAISALKGQNIEKLQDYLVEHSSPGPWHYAEDDMTNLPSKFLASEITREQLFMQMQEELPYKLTVEAESFEELKDASVKINQVIIVSKQNYKSMILGNKGSRIKQIGTKAREEITKVLGRKVHLFLFVKVRADWEENPMNLEYLGLDSKA